MERTKLEQLRDLAIRAHYHSEDPWYSCPKATDGCADDRQGDECNCGADEHNAKVEKLYEEIMRDEKGVA